jgi:hypothetical protein
MQRRYITQYGKDPPSDIAIQPWLKQFQETGNVLHRRGAGRQSTSQQAVDRIQEAFSRSPQKSTRRASLQLGIPQTTVWSFVHSASNETFFLNYTFIFHKQFYFIISISKL